jgi:hypothetical protein
MKKIFSTLIAITLIAATFPLVHAEFIPTHVEVIYFEHRNITDEKLAEMVANGEIPLDTTILWLSSNLISDLTPLAVLTNLRNLGLRENQISDLTPLSELRNLRGLSLGNNQITDLTPLSKLTNLTNLSLIENQITDLSPLSDLINLTTLWLSNNQINDLTPLSELMNLHALSLNGNPVSDEQIAEIFRVLGLNEEGRQPPLTTADALAVLRAAAGVTTLTGGQRMRYGISGEPAAADAVRILRVVAGL